ncbi:ankyrin repeat domain-containing protein [Verrucomicrobium sp. 3C]|uniref:ankyrin repeat domain-containing protein n=1 Tax=Verrucomicrobium sp. 3C TaxID=1134055 RepID=UPI000382CCC5|nr:ankyrin repeat domain-containing protein [Verrucomicrobium sp. 3C]
MRFEAACVRLLANLFQRKSAGIVSPVLPPWGTFFSLGFPVRGEVRRIGMGRDRGSAWVPRWVWAAVAGFWVGGSLPSPAAIEFGEARNFPQGGRWIFVHHSPDIVGFQDAALAKGREEGERDISCLLILPSTSEGLRPRETLERLLRDAYLSYYNELVGSRAPYFRRQKLSFFVIRPGSLPNGQGNFAGAEVIAAGTVGLAEMAAAVFPQEISRRQVRITWGPGEGEASGVADEGAREGEGAGREDARRRKTLSALRDAIRDHSKASLERILASEPRYPIDYGNSDSALAEATRRDPGLASLLVERYGADPAHQASTLVAALPPSANEEAIVRMLQSFFKHGLGIEATSETGQTFLHRCAALGYPTAVAFLLAQGANLNGQDRNGMTPLMIAVERRDARIAKLLLEHGAEAHTEKNSVGESAAEMALRLQDPTLTKLLNESP